MPSNPYNSPRSMGSRPTPSRPADPKRDTSEPMADAARADKAKRLARILAKSKYDTRDDT